MEQGFDILAGSLAVGLILLYLLFIAAIFLFSLFVLYKLISKTGHSGWLCLLNFVPLANIVFYLYMAFSEWPVEREVKYLRQQLDNMRQKISG